MNMIDSSDLAVAIYHNGDDEGLAKILRGIIFSAFADRKLSITCHFSGDYFNIPTPRHQHALAGLSLVLASYGSLASPALNRVIGAFTATNRFFLVAGHSGMQLDELKSFLGHSSNSDPISDIDGLIALLNRIASRLKIEKANLGHLRDDHKLIIEFENQYLLGIRSHGEDYCALSKIARSSRYFELARPILEPLEVDSRLFYAVINTKMFSDCKKILQSTARRLCHPDKGSSRALDCKIWSLLGSSELLLRLRADSQTIEEARTVLNLEVGRNFLEKDTGRHKGLQLIESKEGEELYFSPTAGRPSSTIRIDHERPQVFKRSIKTVIKMEFDGPGHDLRNELRNMANSLAFVSSCVELAVLFHEPELGYHGIIIEARFPCGRFDELQQVSLKLEPFLGKHTTKETFIVYEEINFHGDLEHDAD